MPKPRCLIIRSLSYLDTCLSPHYALRVNIMFFILPSPHTNTVTTWLFNSLRLTPQFDMLSILNWGNVRVTHTMLAYASHFSHHPPPINTHPYGRFCMFLPYSCSLCMYILFFCIYLEMYIFSLFIISMFVSSGIFVVGYECSRRLIFG